MVVKDNRVLKRTNAKLNHRFKEEVWRVKKLEEELLEYKRQNEKYKLVWESLFSKNS